ncbi:L-cysteine desulfidase [Aequitasia blattaphilus]|uniref:UPF0597 protein NK125_14055 n=1 Tax=Aequitasia blattaphilus TaxID=2949332 RepID=A0ABT1ECG2_9FIRM|nr:L-serine ammonia-lyase, iron-sulfur-dependent, subunit alpha [Aequitasia blattaphilus]MCP1103523.1 L-serine ammonia-lyase, iron-sulfur-dependent, subunit alpha [Aequitasia blattaphilus]MCR8616163.1 L-serine ammonia-lyase, iron-sulfur-dependent, subunit alpha [Aequitasia blattaphilus]
MHPLTKIIKEDMKPALGVTEPGAIAFAVAKAKSYTKGEVNQVEVTLSSGIYKNAFTCGIPNTKEVGNSYAAALGAVAADCEKGLEALEEITEEDNQKAKVLLESGKITVRRGEITSRISIKARVQAGKDEAVVTIKDSHINITKITQNGKTLFEKAEENEAEISAPLIHQYTLEELYRYAVEVDVEELQFIKEAFQVNLELFQEALKMERSVFTKHLLKENGNQIFSKDERKSASLLCNGAIEARVLGLNKPAMSITGSGAHGIIATLPLYASYKVCKYEEEKLLRATALSCLICMYIKEYSGKLSAFCGCAIAAGTGMACGLVLLRGGGTREMTDTINNMAGSITGMICDGGNQGCTMKGVIAVDGAMRSVDFAMEHAAVGGIHGINGDTPEETMRNMGRIASPGMEQTEEIIIRIMEEKKI